MRANRRLMMAVLSSLFSLALLCGIGRVLHAADDALRRDAQPGDAQMIEALRKQWLAESKAVKTAEFQVEFFQLFSDKAHPMTREQIERFVAECRTAWSTTGDSAAILQKTRSLDVPKLTFSQCWKQGLIRVEGSKVRNTFRANLLPDARYEELDACFDGSVDIHFVKESHQAWLTEKGPPFVRFGLRNLYFTGPTSGDLKVKKRSGKEVTLESQEGQFVVDTEIGSLVSAAIGSGRATRQITQFGFGQYDVGNAKIVFPSVSARVDYFDNALAILQLFIVKSAQFNKPLEANAFAVAVPERTSAVYYQSPDKVLVPTLREAALSRPPLINVDKALDDVRTLLPRLRERAEAGNRPLPAIPAGRSEKWPILIIANVVALVLIVLYVYLRRPRSPR
jgi:hypothetical protein